MVVHPRQDSAPLANSPPETHPSACNPDVQAQAKGLVPTRFAFEPTRLPILYVLAHCVPVKMEALLPSRFLGGGVDAFSLLFLEGSRPQPTQGRGAPWRGASQVASVGRLQPAQGTGAPWSRGRPGRLSPCRGPQSLQGRAPLLCLREEGKAAFQLLKKCIEEQEERGPASACIVERAAALPKREGRTEKTAFQLSEKMHRGALVQSSCKRPWPVQVSQPRLGWQTPALPAPTLVS